MGEILTEIETTLKRSVCTGWDRTFLESILQQLNRGKILTDRQKTVLKRVLSHNTSEENVCMHVGEWKKEYLSKYYEVATLAAKYHVQNPYYKCLGGDILQGRIPRRKPFIKMINNKHTQKVLREYAKEPRFKPGQYIRPKTNFERQNMSFVRSNDIKEKMENWSGKRHSYLNFIAKGGLIIAIDDEIHSAVKGAKRYKILAIGQLLPFYIEERHMKRG